MSEGAPKYFLIKLARGLASRFENGNRLGVGGMGLLGGVGWSLWLLVEADQHAGQLVDDTALLEVLAVLLLLGLGRLGKPGAPALTC